MKILASFIASIGLIGVVWGQDCPTHCYCNSAHECTSCSNGYWGSTCSSTCPDHCYVNGSGPRCTFEEGTCTSCSNGFWGTTCSNICPDHCYVNGSGPRCTFEEGTCTSCSNGFWGTTCSNICPDHCYVNGSGQRCTFDQGTCTSCTNGYWGTTCSNICPDHCYVNGSGPRCTFDQGTCTSCSNGYWGTTCSSACPSTHCYVNGSGPRCIFEDGSCTSCSGGYSGKYCDVPSSCNAPVGDCSFYSSCLYDSNPCDNVANIMSPKCQEYAELEPSLSKNAQKWSADIRLCLQKKMSSEVIVPASGSVYTCDAADNVFFNEHVDCYLHGSSVSFCDLSAWDKTKVFWHAKDIFFSSHIWSVLESGAQLMAACVSDVSEIGFQTISGEALPVDLLSKVNSTLYTSAQQVGWDTSTIDAASGSSLDYFKFTESSASSALDLGVYSLSPTNSTLSTADVKAFVSATLVSTQMIPADVQVFFNGEYLQLS